MNTEEINALLGEYTDKHSHIYAKIHGSECGPKYWSGDIHLDGRFSLEELYEIMNIFKNWDHYDESHIKDMHGWRRVKQLELS